jgi:prolyl 4-hydroxylase
MTDAAQDLWTVPDFASAKECEQMIARAETIGFQAATINTASGPTRNVGTRNNDRVVIDDWRLAGELWLRLTPHIPAFLSGRQAIGLNERFRFYRYGPQQQFRGHIDAPFRRPTGEMSALTFMIYLNDTFEGGETSFPDTVIKPQRGLALIFRHEIFHEGREVLNGRKYVLRSDVMFNPLGRTSG